MKFGISFLILALVLIPLGALMIINDVPAAGSTNSEFKRVGFQWLPVIAGTSALLLGGFETLMVRAGAIRKDDDAIDLLFTRGGIIVRGSHEIGWESIVGVTSVRYSYQAWHLPDWMLLGLNLGLEVRLNEPGTSGSSRRGTGSPA